MWTHKHVLTILNGLTRHTHTHTHLYLKEKVMNLRGSEGIQEDVERRERGGNNKTIVPTSEIIFK